MRKVYKNNRFSFLIFSLFLFSIFSVDRLNAQVKTNFTPRYHVSQRGAIIYLSNTVITAGSKNGTSVNVSTAQEESPPDGSSINDRYDSKYIDVDGDNSTFNSSWADLTTEMFPACSEISFVGLYWGASSTKPATDRNHVKLKLPNGSYQDIFADPDGDFGVYNGDHYQYFTDITDIVKGNGLITGRYTVANITSTINDTRQFGGWTIVIVYKDDTKPTRDLTVFDGFKGIAGTASLNIPISGFTTPPVGPVKFELGFVAYEGDRGIDGDFMQFNGRTVQDAVHDPDNTFNSSITYNGAVVDSRNPAYKNTLGYDASIMMPDNSSFQFIGNSATSANVTLNTSGDTYAIGVVTTAIDVYNPNYRFTHSYSNITNPSVTPTVGDEVELFYEVENIGNDASTLTTIIDTLPGVFEFVPGSLALLNSDGTIQQTYSDGVSNDQAEYDPVSHKVVFRIGAGANGVSGGSVLPGTKVRVRARVKVTSDCDELRCANPVVDNVASVHYNGTINSSTSGSNNSGPGGAGCATVGPTSIPINVPASCLPPPADISLTIGCTVNVSVLGLPAGYQLFQPSDITFSTPLTQVSATGTYVARRMVRGGCNVTYDVNITVSPLTLNFNPAPPAIRCIGETTVVTLEAGGGNGSYEYKLDAGAYQSGNTFTVPAGNYTFTVKDSYGCEVSKPLVINNPPNTSPVAQNDIYAVLEDNDVSGNVAANDSDADPCDVLVYRNTSDPANGTFLFNADGTFTFTPDANWHGTTSFTYQVCDRPAGDPVRLCATATVTITVSPINDPPTANGDSYTRNEDEVVTGDASTNDTDADGDALTFSNVTTPANGTLVFGTDGKFTFTPNANWSGTTSFDYEVCDRIGLDADKLCSISTVVIRINPINDNPVAGNDAFNSAEDNAIIATVSGNDSDVDGDLLSYSKTSDPANGTLLFNNDGTFTFTPNTNWHGTTSFTYQVCDRALADPAKLCVTATVTLTVTPVNDAPVALDNSYTKKEDEVVTGNVASNDSDVDTPVDGDILTYIQTGPAPANGSLEFNSDGTFTFSPNANWHGTTSFTYQVCDRLATDAARLCDDATVTIAIEPVNDNPIAQNDAFSSEEDQPVSASVAVNDNDPDGDDLYYVNTTDPANGTLVFNNDGSFIFTPDANWFGTTSFAYQVCDRVASDPTKLCAAAIVTLTVASVNDVPVAESDSYTRKEDEVLNGDVSSNDKDVDDDALIYRNTSEPANGTFNFNNDGTFTFTPNNNWYGATSFTYEVCDRSGADADKLCSSTTVTILIQPVNDGPVAANDAFSTNEDNAITATVSGNDSDADGDNLIYVNTSAPENGTLVFNNNGTFTFTPDANWHGTTSFTYQVCDRPAADPAKLCATATVTLTVNPVNDAPVAQNDNYTRKEEETVTGNVASNDGDIDTSVDGDVLTYTQTGPAPANGTLVFNTNGTFTFTPNLNWHGTTTFTYEVCDRTGADATKLCDQETVTIVIEPVNDNPVAQNDSYGSDEDQNINASVAVNDTDADGDALFYTNTTNPENGSLSFSNDGTFVFTPDAHWHGTTSFTYQVCDRLAADPARLCATATVTLTVAPVNDAPIAVADSYSRNEDETVSGNVGANDTDVDSSQDGDLLTYTQTSPAANGTLVFNSNGTFTFTPNANWHGTTSFTYDVCDRPAGDVSRLCASTTVTIVIAAVNDSPRAQNDLFSSFEDVAINAGVSANDSDIDGDALFYTNTSNPENGSLVFNADGTFTFTPDANWHGTTSFTYQVCDRSGSDPAKLCATATVTLTVNPVNDAPAAQDDTWSRKEDETVTGNVASNDSDVDSAVDGDVLTYSLTAPPANGTIVFNSNGTFTFTPTANWYGTSTFTYEVCDRAVADPDRLCDQATVTIVIEPVNDKPIAQSDAFLTNEDVAINASVAVNDSDTDGDPLFFTRTSDPANGTLTFNANGTFTFTPDANWYGTTSFTYEVCDRAAADPVKLCATTTVTLTVTAVNDAPVAAADTYTKKEDEVVPGDVAANDKDVDGDEIVYKNTSSPANGTLLFNSDGTFTFTPTLNWHGTTSFTYEVCDPNLLCAAATVTIVIEPVNDAPVAQNDIFSTNEDNPINASVAVNDNDADGDLLIFTKTTEPENGSLVFNANGTFTFSPDANWHGTTSFSYQVCDRSAADPAKLCATATVTLTVASVNDAPIAVTDTYTRKEDEVVNGNVAANDGDVDGDALLYSNTSDPANGTLAFNPNGTFTFTPTANWHGTTSFTYKVCDGAGAGKLCANSTVTIVIEPLNDRPIAQNDALGSAEDNPINASVAVNDSDVDGDALIYSKTSDPANGVLAFDNNGHFVFTPDADWYGTTSFTYQVCDRAAADPNKLCATATVTLTVAPVNDAPFAQPDNYTKTEDEVMDGNVASNDTDVDGDVLTYRKTSDPANGTLTFNSDGTFSFTPNTNWYGTTSFNYEVCDGTTTGKLCESTTVTINITPVNDRPVAQDDAFNTNEDIALNASVAVNDSDTDGDDLLYSKTTDPENGSLVFNSNGTFTFTPDANWSGTASFTYEVCDRAAGDPARLCASATVILSVAPVNDPPLAQNDVYTRKEDELVAGNVASNDSDVDGDVLTYINTSTPANGTLVFNTDGKFTFTPDANWYGTTSFTYEVCDRVGTVAGKLCESATVTITITPINDAPIAQADVFVANEDVVINAGVGVNDSDADGDPLLYTHTSEPANGTLVFNSNGTFTFTPDANWHGTTSFTYNVCDRGAADPAKLCASATVTLNVAAVNDAPIAANDTYTRKEDEVVAGNVASNDTDADSAVDGDVLTFTQTSPAANGSLVFNSNGTFTFTPNANWNGTTSFTYEVCDRTGAAAGKLCASATVTIVIEPVNDRPVATNDAFGSAEDNTINASVAVNDSDVDADILLFNKLTDPENGTLVFNSNGTFTFTPDANWYGTTSFIYEVCDRAAGDAARLCATATVTLTVSAVNDAPLAQADTYTKKEDEVVSGNVASNDSDVDGDVLTYINTTNPANGTLVFNSDGKFTFTPNANWHGTTTFTYEVCDRSGATAGKLCANTTVTIVIEPVNDSPVAQADTYTTTEDKAVSGNAGVNDTDVDGDVLVYANTTEPANGTLVFNSNGTFTFTPNANWSGTTSFTYQVCDRAGSDLAKLCTSTTVTLTVTAVNDAPVALDDSYTKNEDEPVNGAVAANDTDVDGDLLTYTASSAPVNGTFVFNSDGTFIFTPDANWHGTTGFDYEVCDRTGAASGKLCDQARVTIVIEPVNDAPVVQNETYRKNEDLPVNGSVATNDSDADGDLLRYILTDEPENGTITFNSQGAFTFTPNSNWHGTTTFSYEVCDRISGDVERLCAAGTATIIIDPVNDAPLAVNDTYEVNEEEQVIGNVSLNDSDVDADALNFTVNIPPSNGSLVFNADGTFTFTPNPDWHGTTSFSYQVCDRTGAVVEKLCADAVVNITVNPVNDPPVAVNDTYQADEDQVLNGKVSINDSDVDEDILTYIQTSSPANGTLVFNSSGAFSFTPDLDWYGTTTFTYQVCDRAASDPAKLCATATVTIVIDPVSDAPIAIDDDYVVNEEETVSGNVSSNDSDVDGDALNFVATSSPANGTLFFNVDGTFTFKPDANWYGSTSFTYDVCDRPGTDPDKNCTEGVVTITVNPVNDAPVAVNDNYKRNEDQSLNGSVSINDSDVDGDLLTYKKIGEPEHGTFTFNSNGTFTFNPDANWHGTTSFSYEVCDPDLLCATATATIVIDPVNDVPVAQNDNYTVSEETPVIEDMSLNDSDVDGDELTYTVLTTPSNGTFDFKPDGTFTFIPNANWFGTTSFTYTACDRPGAEAGKLCADAVVTITVSPVNDAPLAVNDDYRKKEDQTVIGNISQNDSDIDGDALIFTKKSDPEHGTFTFSSTGAFTFTPEPNWHGTTSFTYEVCDRSGADPDKLCATATVTIVIDPVNDAPVAVNDSYEVLEDNLLSGNVSENDTDVDGDLLTYVILNSPANGSIDFRSNGTFTFKPYANWSGTTTFSYQVCDRTGTAAEKLCAEGSVTITVKPVNDAPVATDDNYRKNEDQKVNGNVSLNDTDIDGDILRFSKISDPEHGTFDFKPDGTFTFTPDLNWHGTTSFTYEVCDRAAGDAESLCASGIVTIVIDPINDAPIAVNDSYAADEDSQVSEDVSLNDSDVDGDALTFINTSDPANGTLVFNADGKFTFKPNPNWYGTTSFNYQVCDRDGAVAGKLCSDGVVTITVNPVNDGPVAVNDEFRRNEDQKVTGNVSLNDTDVDGDMLNFSKTGEPENGTLTFNSDGTFTFTPNANWHGTTSFTYEVCDRAAADPLQLCAAGRVTIVIDPVNDAPIAVNDTYSVNEDNVLGGNVGENDSDIDGDDLTYTKLSDPANGTLLFNPDGTFTFTPKANWNGTTSFNYQVCDREGAVAGKLCDDGIVTITVNPVNDGPLAVDESYRRNEGQSLTGDVSLNDSDVDDNVLLYTITAGPENGTFNFNPDGTFTFVPNANWHGTTSFSYEVCDRPAGNADRLCASGTTTIVIDPVNDAPVAVSDSYTILEDSKAIDNVSLNDTDVDGDALTFVTTSNPANGTLVFNTNGTFTFTPNANWYGTTTFNYQVCDRTGAVSEMLCDNASVIITVTPVNDGPLAVNDDFRKNEDQSVSGSVGLNDTDTDGDALIFRKASDPEHGTFTFNADGTFVFTPELNWHGTTSFTYEVCDRPAADPSRLCATATATITIDPVNDAPVAANDSYSVNEDTQLAGNVGANDSDIDGDLLTFTKLGDPANGTLVFSADGTFTFTPKANWYGTTSFSYNVCDRAGSEPEKKCVTAMVSITVNPVNDGPVAANDTYRRNEDQQVNGNVSLNDADADGDALTFAKTSDPENGTFVFNADGTFTFTPNANWHGTTSFTYDVCDRAAGDASRLCATGRVTITIDPVNDVPVAADDSYTIDEDASLTANVALNDHDVDGDQLTFTKLGNPANGTLVFNADGTFTFTPNANWFGTTSFDYRVCDREGADAGKLCAEASVIIVVEPVNDRPGAGDDTFSSNEDFPINGNVALNDRDTDGDVLLFTPKTNPEHGTFVFNADGTFLFTPEANWYGSTEFTYEVCDRTAGDPAGLCVTAIVRLTVHPVNDAPLAANDLYTINEDGKVIDNVGLNDSDVDGDALTFTKTTSPANGTLEFNADGTFTFTPDANWYGSTSFNYQVCDRAGAASEKKCADAMVTITVKPVNDAPVAVNDNYRRKEDEAVTGNVSINDRDVDGDVLNYSKTSNPEHGTFTFNPDGTFTFTPDANWHGTTSFNYEVCDRGAADAERLCSSGVVTITLDPVNDGPVATNDAFSIDEDKQLTGNVSLNDNDVDGDVLIFTNLNNPANGSLVFSTDGKFTFTPNANWYGTTSFSYTVCDRTGAAADKLCATAVVTITVNPVNDAPLAVNDDYRRNEDQPVNGNAALNDTDVDGDALTYTKTTDPQHGSLVFNSNGTFTFTPDANWHGTTSFIYEVCDRAGADAAKLCASGTVTIVIDPVNDAPVAINDSYTIDEDNVLTGDVSLNDSDVDGDELTFTQVTPPGNGTLVFNSDGTFTYTPAANWFGTTNFTYQVCDRAATSFEKKCVTTTVVINVLSINDAPVAHDDIRSSAEDTPLTFNITLNDSDLDGSIDRATVDLDVNAPGEQKLIKVLGEGSYAVDPAGNITFTPALNYHGQATEVSYTVKDNLGLESQPGKIKLTVESVNDMPVANDDEAVTDEDTPKRFNLTANDTDIDGTVDPAGITILTQPEHGTVTVHADGTVTYTPLLNYYGPDSFRYSIKDNEGGASASAIVMLTVLDVNDAPVAEDDIEVTDEDTPKRFSLSQNDTDLDGTVDPSTISIVNDPSHGAVEVHGDGTVTYTPALDHFGTDSFTYTIRDDDGGVSNVATVTLNIRDINDAPIANDDTETTNEDTPKVINLVVNDTDVDGTVDRRTVVIVQQPSHGTVEVHIDGTATYTPELNYFGSDSFTYTVKDNDGGVSNEAQVVVTIADVNDLPTAVDDTNTTREDEAITFSLTANDTDTDGTIDPATLNIVSQPAHGTVTVHADGTITYSPALNYFGNDSFRYTVKDNDEGMSNEATVTLSISDLNDAPVAVNDEQSTSEDESVTFSITANDTDVDGTIDPGSVTILEQPAHGTLALNADGTVIYSPHVNYLGADRFTYTVKDDEGVISNAATVSLTVIDVNDLPVAADDAATTNEDEAVAINLTANDTDVDGTIDPATIRIIDAPGHGIVQVHSDGTVTYTPEANYFGNDSFTYGVKDNDGGESNVAKVTLTVADINDAPVAAADQGSTKEDESVTIVLTDNDTDADGSIDAGTVAIINPPAHGTITVSADGTVNYTPALNYKGDDTFTYSVRDNDGAESNAATVIITVLPVNDAPVAVDDSYSGEEDVDIRGNVSDNDSDIDGDALTFAKTSDPANGTLAFNEDGTFTFTPNLNWNGTISFTYEVCDREEAAPARLCDQATVVITISGINDAPLPVEGDYTTPEDTQLSSDVVRLINDVDGNSNLIFTRVSDPEHGTVTLDANGTFIYNPSLNYNGPDQFSVQVEDGNGGTVTFPVKIIVTPVNDAPVAQNDDFCTCGKELEVKGNVLKNDSDLDRDPIIATLLSRPSNGTLTFNENGSFIFKPRPGFAGNVSFTYQACDNGSPRYCSNIATVNIRVLPNPLIGLAKSVTTPVRELNGSYTFTYNFTVKNYGNVDLEEVQITDDLAKVFASPMSVTIRDLSVKGSASTFKTNAVNSGNDVFAINKNYNGISFKDLLESGNGLAIGESKTIALTVNVLLNGIPGTFNNQAIAVGHANGDMTMDTSQDGIEPDLNEDGNPNEEKPTPVSLEASKIYVPGGFSPNGDGVNDKFIIENTGTDRINLEVFNRWGNVIFKHADYKNDWEGTSTQGIRIGDQVPDGTYYYVIVVNNTERLVGYITIKR